jgi:outer membrane protein
MRPLILFVIIWHSVALIEIKAQKIYSLDQCIALALNNKNLRISSNVLLEKSLVNYKFDLFSCLPSISGNGSYTINNGRKLDLFTNTFGSNTVFSNTFDIRAQLNLFQGFRYLKQNEINRKLIEKSEIEIEKENERIKVQVIDRFLAIRKAELEEQQHELTLSDIQKILNVQKELFKAGKISSIDTLQTKVLLKSQQIRLVNIHKKKDLEILHLNYLIGVKLTDDMSLNMAEQHHVRTYCDEDYQIEIIVNQLETLKEQFGLMLSQFYPSLSLSGFQYTGYSTNNKDYTQPQNPVYNYTDQIKNNRYQGIGLNINIPVFNKGEFFKQRKLFEIAKSEQELELKNKQIEKERTILELHKHKDALNEVIRLNESIVKDKRVIYEMNFSLFESGKIRLSDLDKELNEYMSFRNSLEELKLELFKLSLYDFHKE